MDCKRNFMLRKLLTLSTGAIVGLIAIGQVEASFAQAKNNTNQVANTARNAVKKPVVTAKGKPASKVTAKKPASDKTANVAQAKPAIAPTNRLPHSAEDLKESNTLGNFHSVATEFQPSSSIQISTKANKELLDIAASTDAQVAQLDANSSPDQIQQELLIPPITTQTQNVFIKRIYTPSLNAGTPVAFGLETGDAFIAIFGATAGRLRDTFDGSVSVGTGLGNASQYFAVEGVYNVNSIRNFGSNGSFDLKVHRLVYEDFYRQVGVAVGWTNFANYGTNAGGTPSSVYGAATISQLTDPDNLDNPKPLIATVGVGGGTYRKSTSNGGVGVFANLGLQFDPQWGGSVAWSGQGLNFGLGFLPDPTIPLNLTLTYSDVTNNSDAGTQLIFGVSYGFNYTGRK